ncbi:hypothetical protein E4K10_20640 [Streptomyces sp. T1317-0309]|nr:hypothetical protein E4K10_20640 [Streptomyces sp. T1317-0309]
MGRFERSLRTDAEALALARKARFKRPEADSILGLALTHQQLGRHDGARHAEEALRMARGTASEWWRDRR